MGDRHKDKFYKPYSFRLDDPTVAKLTELKGDLSWNKFFLNVIRNYENETCYFCGRKDNLEKHHIIAKKDGGSDAKDNIMLLCISCHKKTENWGNKKNELRVSNKISSEDSGLVFNK